MASQPSISDAFTASPGDPRKTAAVADAKRTRETEAIQITDAATARTVLRSKCVRQAGFGAESFARGGALGNPPVIMLDGEPHRRQRAATARFFSPAIVSTQYTELMEATAKLLVDRIAAQGEARLEDLSMELAVTIAAEIVGLTNSDRSGMSRRMNAFFRDGSKPGADIVSRTITRTIGTLNRMNFMVRDVWPAIRSRRRERRFDVISHLIDEGYNNTEILVECIVYGLAGMITTREFILMAFWQMMEQPELAQRFLAEDRRGQVLIMEEILRTEPIVGVLSRRSDEEITLPSVPPQVVPAGTLFQIDIRGANADETAVGACPFAIDPDRASAQKTGGSMFAFGDGVHRCPGAQVALYETAIFLDRLLRLPGLHIASTPKITWKAMIEGYEVNDMIVRCDRTG